MRFKKMKWRLAFALTIALLSYPVAGGAGEAELSVEFEAQGAYPEEVEALLEGPVLLDLDGFEAEDPLVLDEELLLNELTLEEPEPETDENASKRESWKALQKTINQAKRGQVIRLTEDITAPKHGAGLVIPRGKTVTLDLAGYALDRGLEVGKANGYVILVRGKLTVIDSSGEKTGRITGGHNSRNGGAIVVEANGTLRLSDGRLSGNTSAGYGGAVYVQRGGSFIMSGGRIENNSCNKSGGGIYITQGTFKMKGGEIADNASMKNGGGLCAVQGEVALLNGVISGNAAGKSGGGVYVLEGKLAMSGASVNANWASLGGGAYVSKSSFTMRRGSISGNTADNRGAGVLFLDSKIKIFDSPVIAENQCILSGTGEPNNACIESDAVVRIGGPLASTARIGISSESHVFTRGLGRSGNIGAFFSDSGLFVIQRSEEGNEAQIVIAQDSGGRSRIQPWTGEFEYIAYSCLYDEPFIHKNATEFFQHYSSDVYGFNVIKGDVRPTADHGIVMCHDEGFTLNAEGRIASFDRTNCVKIHDLTLQQCLSLKYDNVIDGQYTSVCDFETFISICAQHNKVAFITIRDEYIPELLDTMMPLIYKYGMQNRCIVNSFDLESLEMTKRYDPSVRLSWVIKKRTLTTEIVDQAAALGNCALTLYSFTGGSDSLEMLALYEYEIIYAQSRNISLYAAIAHDASIVDRLRQMGIRGAQFIVCVYA